MPPITTSNPSAAADEVMPSKTAMMYGLCSLGTTTSMARVSSRGRAELDPAGRYLESLRCFCTRRRVSGETSARSLSTFDTVGTETPAASAISASVVRPFGTVASGTKVSATRNYYDSPVSVLCTPKAGALTQSPDRPYLKQCLRLFRNFSKLDDSFQLSLLEDRCRPASIPARVDTPTATPCRASF